MNKIIPDILENSNPNIYDNKGNTVAHYLAHSGIIPPT